MFDPGHADAGTSRRGSASSLRPPQRSHALWNHARILAAACEELGRNPSASLDEIARAVGVARRTVYEHFPSRQALIAALAGEATQTVAEAFAAARRPGADPPTVLAGLVLACWAAGDRYRMLIALGRRDLGEYSIRAVLVSARAEAASILAQGQRDGTFADCVPAPVLTLALQSFARALLESDGSARWRDPTGEAAATAVLIAAGVAPAAARHYVRTVLNEDRHAAA